MDTSHCRYRGFILLLVLFYSHVFDLASNIAKQIAKINFADYGNPIGECEDFRRDKAGAPATLSLVKHVSKINEH
ncbi:PREDICTED: LOW QUALITY PROTEIN: uncharacterized protein LOC106302963 [Brassica oleracea var. oleracea]|uniref:LOW QUALITY PROTEIN: uncharacterized protein LOC106302963 n=1 Tax=Brassica oleracea var. oleracea TaxID=109376 RepID=UPI0006A736A0|nr:PREDICTED: LOW QUALITY PROTEIN: uncharacterized protein LOC106302963 [Brassica oleracea var. oleracea]